MVCLVSRALDKNCGSQGGSGVFVVVMTVHLLVCDVVLLAAVSIFAVQNPTMVTILSKGKLAHQSQCKLVP